MSLTPTSDLNLDSDERRRRAQLAGSQWVRLLLLFPVACAALTVSVLLHLAAPSAGDQDYSWLAIVAFDLLGPLGLAVLIRIGGRYWPKGILVVLAACLVVAAGTFWALIDLAQSEDANAALLVLVLPIYQVALVVAFAALAALTHWVRNRTSRSGAR